MEERGGRRRGEVGIDGGDGVRGVEDAGGRAGFLMLTEWLVLYMFTADTLLV